MGKKTQPLSPFHATNRKKREEMGPVLKRKKKGLQGEVGGEGEERKREKMK